MPTSILDRIVSASGVPQLFELLAEQIAPTDLQSLLLEVYRRRAAAVTPAHLASRYAANRLVQPSPVSPLTLLEFDRLAFALAGPIFEPLELAPVCPLGTSSAIAAVDQNQALATVRNIEVVSDLTNVLALECAERRRAALREHDGREQRTHLCASHRVLRPQTLAGPGAFSHFRLFGLSSAGRDRGAFRFEIETCLQQVGFYVRLLQSVDRIGLAVAGLRVALTPLPGGPGRAQLEQQLAAPLRSRLGDDGVLFDEQRSRGRGYYTGLCFEITASIHGIQHSLVDGGFTDWTERLLSSRKERLLISGIGSERVCSVFKQIE